uniref:LOW QUALITY PROTEIN: deleted in lung and esophageal cancer protein 1-like n=1 Tax=Saccoglossus kowalevskii TaxID=10224 RepID=A0ABM0MAT8_SACKO|nr:PREDICTED: LOW QUALITY PROTEIN: deleted in lung and esophageal cancer protein 1-like [Saccoglossus kowalevskii]
MSAKVNRLPDSEPPMYLQRPSSGKSQDVTHILASTFRELFTRDFVEQERVKNLNISRSTDDEYHERYVEQLRKVQAERERRMAEAAMLERHIMQARARAMSADERDLNKAAEGHNIYHNLGLPPVESNYKYCLDSEMLKQHHLIVPEDFSTAEPPLAPPPRASSRPHYAKETVTSTKHIEGIKPVLPKIEEDSRSKPEKTSLDNWKEHMHPAKREIDRTDLALLHHRSDFLRNPRHRPPSAPEGSKTLIKPNTIKHKLGGAKAQVIETAKVKEPSVVFLASPETVVFSNYQVGHVYEMTLELKNISTASRQLRVIPPKSQYFTVGLGKFPGEQGIVAPGMSVQYNIRFVPDSLMDYDDFITIQTQSSTPLKVKLQGRRPPPLLTLPSVIDCGHCLVGGVKISQFIVNNYGGHGRFCIMPRQEWPHFRALSNVVDLPPFHVRPAMFELPANQATIIEVVFKPSFVKTFTQEITVICDNCQVQHFTLKGEAQLASVELSLVSDGEQFSMLGELCDATAQHLVKFDNLNPMTYTQKTMVVRNKTNVELPFTWQVFKPHIENPYPGEEDMNSGLIVRYPNYESVFYITPDSGSLPPDNTQEFTITFAPMKVGDYHDTVHLILQQIPEIQQLEEKQEEDEGNVQHYKDEGFDDERRSTSESISSMQSSKPKTPDEIAVQDMTGLEIEIKGACDPLDVQVKPYAIVVPGKLLVTTTIRRQFLMENHSMSSAKYKWSSLRDCHIIEIEHPEGEIDGGDTFEMNMSISGGKPGKIDHTLICQIEHRIEPLTLRIQADIKGPEVVVRTPSLDFGLVKHGESATHDIVIENTSQIAAKWKIQESNEFLSKDSPEIPAVSNFVFTPAGGELSALGSVTVKVLFQPTLCKRYNTVFDIMIEEGVNSFLSACAEVQHPQACLLSCQLNMPEVYVGVPVRNTIKLLNQTLLPAQYKWGELEGEHAPHCVIELNPNTGCLGSREELSIDVTFTVNQPGEVNDCRIPCTVEGMDRPIYLALFCDVKGLVVFYKTPKTDFQPREEVTDETLSLNFEEVNLGCNAKRYVHITNTTAIAASFNIVVDYFVAGKPPTPPDRKDAARLSGQRRGLLGRTPNLADPLSKTSSKAQADYTKAVLRDGRGTSFIIQPETGILPPFGEQVIEVTAYSDMWGQYSDILICKVEDLDPVIIPIEMTVVGCPLNFQMMAAIEEQMPIIRFGTHVSGVQPVTRTMRVNNTSPYDIRLDWQTYNLGEEDSKLVDLLYNIGDPFPLLDEHGEEIVPTEVIDEPPPVEPPRDKFYAETPDTELTTPGQRSLATTHAHEEEKKPWKLITIKMREHEGVMRTEPYDIQPRQVVIPARSHISVTASYTPYTNSTVESGTDCVGYALGFMSLDNDRVQSIKGCVQRQQALDVMPLRLDFTAHVKPALLTLETVDDDGMIYNAAVSDLMQGTQLQSNYMKTCSCKLTNMTETPLTFKLVTLQPFVLVNLDPPESNSLFRQKSSIKKQGINESQLYTLRPQYNLQVL